MNKELFLKEGPATNNVGRNCSRWDEDERLAMKAGMNLGKESGMEHQEVGGIRESRRELAACGQRGVKVGKDERKTMRRVTD